MSLGKAAASLSDFYASEFARIRHAFESAGDGLAAASERARLVDGVVVRLYQEHLATHSSGPEGFCLVALGGYGRNELFPQSDIDLLFLSENNSGVRDLRDGVAALARALWDLKLRVANTSRTLAECGELHRDNMEFNVALLDCRYLAGDGGVFTRLRERTVPRTAARDHAEMVRRLLEMTEMRYGKYGGTIFHLEPNLKEAPGGLRDYHLARWLSRLFELERSARWIPPEELWSRQLGTAATGAHAFLAEARTFLHYRQERDDNHLTYELQDEAAAAAIGLSPRAALPPEEWMRHYFRHARSIHRLTAQLIEESAPPRTSLYGLFQDWRSRLSTPDFSVVRGRIFLRQPAAFQNAVDLLGLFEFAARHGLDLSREAERHVEQAIPRLDDAATCSAGLWQALRRIFIAPHATAALRSMHRLGLLDALFPEFRAIDSLVVRDFYHRYTVDAHTLLTLENLERLRHPERGRAFPEWQGRFAEILGELEQPELLFLALLFHDVGKGLDLGDHVRGSLNAAESVSERLSFEATERETVRFLILNHLEMSATVLRRDIFDAETVRAFAEKVGTAERLKMLTLLTYADVQSVNPEALTPWKGEMLWQLYAATSNRLTRSLDSERIQAGSEEDATARILPHLPPSATPSQLQAFLAGFPRRYVLTHSAKEIAAHFESAQHLGDEPVQVMLGARDHSYELTVLTSDRPFLFARLAGTLAAWGMNILKAEAFSNAAGIVLDTFRFADLHQTLELNPSERGRFCRHVAQVVTGRLNLQELLRGRVNPQTLPRTKVRVPTQIRFEDAPASSQPERQRPRSTLLEVIAQDRPGLLYQISSALAELGLNIEVALIDTEGQKAIDVFYLTTRGTTLDAQEQEEVRKVLLHKLG